MHFCHKSAPLLLPELKIFTNVTEVVDLLDYIGHSWTTLVVIGRKWRNKIKWNEMIYKGMVCQWCGGTFTAQKSSTRYCSKRCANLANKQKIREMTQGIVESQNMEKLRLIDKEREVMSSKALAEYLGICKSTAYNYLRDCRLMSSI